MSGSLFHHGHSVRIALHNRRQAGACSTCVAKHRSVPSAPVLHSVSHVIVQKLFPSSLRTESPLPPACAERSANASDSGRPDLVYGVCRVSAISVPADGDWPEDSHGAGWGSGTSVASGSLLIRLWPFTCPYACRNSRYENDIGLFLSGSRYCVRSLVSF